MTGSRNDSGPQQASPSGGDDKAIREKSAEVAKAKVNEYHNAQRERLKDANMTKYIEEARKQIEAQYVKSRQPIPVFTYTKDIEGKDVNDLAAADNGPGIEASANTILKVGTYRLSGGDHEFKVSLSEDGKGVSIKPIPPATGENFDRVMSNAMDLFALNSADQIMRLNHGSADRNFFKAFGGSSNSYFERMVNVALTKPVFIDADILLQKGKEGGHLTLAEADAIAEKINIHNNLLRAHKADNEVKLEVPTAPPLSTTASVSPQSENQSTITQPGAETQTPDEPTIAETSPSVGGLESEAKLSAKELLDAVRDIGAFADESEDFMAEMKDMLESDDKNIGLTALNTITIEIATVLADAPSQPEPEKMAKVKSTMESMIDKKADLNLDNSNRKSNLNDAMNDSKNYIDNLGSAFAPKKQ